MLFFLVFNVFGVLSWGGQKGLESWFKGVQGVDRKIFQARCRSPWPPPLHYRFNFYPKHSEWNFVLYVLICTCVVVSGESDAMRISSLQNLSSGFLLESVGRRSIHNILWKLVPVYNYSLAEERPTNPTSISRLRQFQTVSSQIVSGIREFKELSRIKGFCRPY